MVESVAPVESVRPFRAYVAERLDDGFRRGVRELTVADLPPGDVLVRVEWSGVNYKDGLAARADGKVARISPLVPGIDLAGHVLHSDDDSFGVGDRVLVSGYDLGVAWHGGYGELACVPAAWVVPLPERLTTRQSMAIGTAGFTAAMSVEALEARGLRPDSGPVLVTGASGGLGRLAVGILAARGYEAWALTGKPDGAARLHELGAVGVLGREELEAAGTKPLAAARWAGAIDAVGGPAMAYILATLQPGGAVASCGKAGGPGFSSTVLPFILRGVAVLGMNSVAIPIEERRALWNRLATDLRPRGLGEDVTEVTLDTLEAALDAIVAGRARGRWVVRVGA